MKRATNADMMIVGFTRAAGVRRTVVRWSHLGLEVTLNYVEV